MRGQRSNIRSLYAAKGDLRSARVRRSFPVAADLRSAAPEEVVLISGRTVRERRPDRWQSLGFPQFARGPRAGGGELDDAAQSGRPPVQGTYRSRAVSVRICILSDARLGDPTARVGGGGGTSAETVAVSSGAKVRKTRL